MMAGLKAYMGSMFSGRQKMTSSGVFDTTIPSALISVTAESLIELRQQARAVPLKAIKIISPKNGAYLSPFKGRGMEYEQSRPYQPGDDVRNLDWRVTARSGKTYTKQFREERERVVLMWVDYRASMQFATRGVFKSVLAARAAVLLAWSAVQQGDRVGGLIFDESEHHELRPKSGDKAVLHLIKRLCNHHYDTAAAGADSPYENSSDEALLRLRRVARPGSLVFLISDFRNLGTQAESHMMQLSRHNDVVMVNIYDPLERALPAFGHYRISDGHDIKVLNAHDERVRIDHRKKFQQHQDSLERLSRRYGMLLMSCVTDQAIDQSLQRGLRLKKQ